MDSSRRKTIKQIGFAVAGIPTIVSLNTLLGCTSSKEEQKKQAESSAETPLFFKISLAQWSLHRSFFGASRQLPYEEFAKLQASGSEDLFQGELKPIDFPVIAKQQFGIEAVEYVNQFFFTRAEDTGYLNELKTRCDDNNVTSLLIMCDGEGNLGDLNEEARLQAVENHYKWINAAKYLGCHSIRVNAAGSGSAEEVKQSAIDGLGRLTEYAAKENINVIVENHGGYSSDGQWLADVMKGVNHKNCGTLPDFGNFCIEHGTNGCSNEYDRYKGVKQLMPYAKGVSAKSHEFDADGNEKHTDFTKMLTIIKESGFNGYIGVEFEGDNVSEKEGIKMTKTLLETVGAKVS